MNWLELNSFEDLEKILDSKSTVAIFKHSTRCPISSMARHKVEKGWDKAAPATNIYYLDLIEYRDISNGIAEKLNVEHQSPQLLILKEGKVLHHSSHLSIDPENITSYI